MAGKVKIRAVSKLSLIVTIILTTLCIGISTYGLQKYAVLRNSLQEYVSCESAILQFIKGSDTLTEQTLIKNVPYLECEQCGEKYYTDEVAERLETIVNMARKLMQQPVRSPAQISSILIVRKKV